MVVFESGAADPKCLADFWDNRARTIADVIID